MGLAKSLGGVALAALALCGCRQDGAAESGQALVVRTVMKEQVNPATLAIWDIGNNAMGDDALLDASKLDDAKWAALAQHAGALGAAAEAMAKAGSFTAAAENDMAVAEGEVPMADVQKALDADPAGFKSAAQTLADHAGKLASAAKTKDAKVAGELVAGLDQACEGCHMKYWYPKL